MPAGKRFKFHGSQIEVMTGYVDDSPSKVITGITNANPAVVTSAAHGYANGDVVRITGVAGMVEVNDELFVVTNQTTNTFELADVDSTDYGVWTSGGWIDEGAFSNFCELTNYNRQGGTSPDIPATSLCSTAQEYEIGLPDFGTTQLDFNFAPRTTIQGALHTFHASGDKMAVRITLPNDGGYLVQLGFVQQESETAGANGIWTASGTIRNTGARVDIAA